MQLSAHFNSRTSSSVYIVSASKMLLLYCILEDIKVLLSYIIRNSAIAFIHTILLFIQIQARVYRHSLAKPIRDSKKKMKKQTQIVFAQPLKRHSNSGRQIGSRLWRAISVTRPLNCEFAHCFSNPKKKPHEGVAKRPRLATCNSRVLWGVYGAWVAASNRLEDTPSFLAAAHEVASRAVVVRNATAAKDEKLTDSIEVQCLRAQPLHDSTATWCGIKSVKPRCVVTVRHRTLKERWCLAKCCIRCDTHNMLGCAGEVPPGVHNPAPNKLRNPRQV